MSRVATLVEYVSGRAFRSLVSRHVAAKSDGPCHLSVQSARSHRGELAKPASLRAPLVVIPAKQKTLTPRLEDLPGVGKLQFLFFAAFILAFASPASEARIPVRCSIHRCSDTNASYGGRAPVLSTISLFFLRSYVLVSTYNALTSGGSCVVVAENGENTRLCRGLAPRSFGKKVLRPA